MFIQKLWLIFLLVPSFVFSQDNLHLMIFGGLSNYQGDLRNKQFSLDQAQGAFGVELKYDLAERVALRTGVYFAKIEGDDKKNPPPLVYRNLNFQTSLTEGNI